MMDQVLSCWARQLVVSAIAALQALGDLGRAQIKGRNRRTPLVRVAYCPRRLRGDTCEDRQPVQVGGRAGAAALAVAFSGVAHADPSDPRELTGEDLQYLHALAGQGISVGSSMSQHSVGTLIGMAHGVCEELGEGKTPGQNAFEIASAARINPNDPLGSIANAGFLVAAAVAVYCPQYRSLIR